MMVVVSSWYSSSQTQQGTLLQKRLSFITTKQRSEGARVVWLVQRKKSTTCTKTSDEDSTDYPNSYVEQTNLRDCEKFLQDYMDSLKDTSDSKGEIRISTELSGGINHLRHLIQAKTAFEYTLHEGNTCESMGENMRDKRSYRKAKIICFILFRNC